MEQLIPRTLRLWENMSSNLSKSAVFSQFQGMTKGHLTLRLKDDPGTYSFGYGNKVKAEIFVENERFFQRFWSEGELGFGESYVEGDWNSPDLAQVIRWFFLNGEQIETAVRPDDASNPFLQFMVGLRYVTGALGNRSSTLPENWASRYDLERPFFSLMLDSKLNNSGALFTKNDNLEEAQARKHRKIARELRIRPGSHILELGCGWGSFAIYLAQTFDCYVTAVTLSNEQFEYLSAKVKELGLESRVQALHADYRMVQGVYDRIVSIELIDTIEFSQLPDFFQRCEAWLKPNGIMVHQLLLSPEHRRLGESHQEWKERHIAPGIKTPSLSQLLEAMGETSPFSVRSLRDTGLSYSKTLHHWAENFVRNLEAVRGLGFDETFIRSWHYYLCYAEAAFEYGLMSSAQITLSRAMERSQEQLETQSAKILRDGTLKDPFRAGASRSLKSS